jgi:hypothetical protein
MQRPGQERAGESGEQPGDGEGEDRAGAGRDELPACVLGRMQALRSVGGGGRTGA